MQPSATAVLRQSIARIEGMPIPAAAGLVALGHSEADQALGGGLRRAALHEIFPATEVEGLSACGFAIGLAQRAAGRSPLLWIRQDLSAVEWGEPFAPGLAEFGLDPDPLVLVRVSHPTDALRAAWDALHCAALGAVVVESWGGVAFDLTASRRLGLAAGRSGVTAIMLRLAARPAPSAAQTRWLVQAAPSQAGLAGVLGWPAFDASLVRNRKGRTGRWLMEWNSDAYLFRARPEWPAHSGPVDAPAPHRPDPTPAVVDPIRKTG